MMDAHLVVEVDPVFVRELLAVATIARVGPSTTRGSLVGEVLLVLLVELLHELGREVLKTSGHTDYNADDVALEANKRAGEKCQGELLRQDDLH